MIKDEFYFDLAAQYRLFELGELDGYNEFTKKAKRVPALEYLEAVMRSRLATYKRKGLFISQLKMSEFNRFKEEVKTTLRKE